MLRAQQKIHADVQCFHHIQVWLKGIHVIKIDMNVTLLAFFKNKCSSNSLFIKHICISIIAFY